ncbi:MAG: hypothetical protein QM569_09770 [Acidovorax sp.]
MYKALRNADAAGDTEGAKRLAAYISEKSGYGQQAGGAPQVRNTVRTETEVSSGGVNRPVNTETGFAPSIGQRIASGGMELVRQAGLTMRHGMEGLGQAAEVVTEPVRHLVTDPAMRALGAPEGKPLGKTMGGFADAMGLPKPANEMERVVGDAARFMAGGAGMAGAAGQVARVATGPLQAAAELLAAQPGAQVAGAAGAGAATGLAREAGGGDGWQLAAGLAGGFAGAGVAQAATAVGRNMLPASAQAVEQQIEQALGRAGVNWQDVPERIRQSLRAEAARAMGPGDSLDGGALARLVDFQRVGATPTRGTVSLDPVQVTREQNLARMGANATDTGLHGLARVQNENNATLIESLNRLGAGGGDDAHAVGARAIGALQRGLDSDKAAVDALYNQARDSAGRSFPLDGHAFTTQASKLLDDALLGGALPPSVSQHLNRIAAGEVPFTVDYAEQLKTAMGKLQRGTSDGQTRMALGLVRQALDDAPVLELGAAGPAAGARAGGGGQPYAGGVELGEQARQAFDRARLANRDMMRRVERHPGLKAVYEGNATPDDFVQRHVISPPAKALDTALLAAELRRSDPQALEAVRGSIAAYLKAAAIGSASDETGRFSASGYNRALLKLGSRKLAQFFDKDEIALIRSVGRVSQYTTAQPVGSAVNNSNSGALLMGRGLDLLDRLSSKVPLLGIGPTVSTATRGMQQRQAQDVGAALVRRQTQDGRRAPALTFGALMASQEH